MKKNWRILLILFAGVLTIALSLVFRDRIQYLSDSLQSRLYSFHYTFFGGASGGPSSDPSMKRYIHTYDRLPSGYIHVGHLLFYKSDGKATLGEIASKALKYTQYFRTSSLRDAIQRFNGLQLGLQEPGRLIYIPCSLPPFQVDIRKQQKPKLVFTRGLYYSGSSIANEKILKHIESYGKLGINTVVFDAKDVTGIINYQSNVPEAKRLNTHGMRTIDDIDKLIRKLKEKGVYVIARIAVFRDHVLFKSDSRYAIKSIHTGQPWNAASKELWCDPTSKAVQDYNIALAVELADKGVDEIQFDYIRFPTHGKLSEAQFAWSFGRMSKEEAITHFLQRAYQEISRRNTLVSIDIFGVVAWGKTVDINKTGQRIEKLSRYCDVISPMLYPSHFNDDFDGFSRPGDHPYHFIYHGCKKVLSLSGNRPIRPWLQAFKWRVSAYNENYILEQIKASDDSGARGYLFWNASNSYDIVLRALTIQEARRKTGSKNSIAKNSTPEKDG